MKKPSKFTWKKEVTKTVTKGLFNLWLFMIFYDLIMTFYGFLWLFMASLTTW